MNYWIQGKLQALKKILQRIDILIVNDAETRQLAEEPNIVRAAKKILSWGPKFLIVKRGEYGALMFSNNQIFSAPGFPLEYVYDPTGAGDSFAGGFMGYLANVDTINEANIRRAIIFGSTMASFCVEDFSLNRLNALTYPEIEKRYKAFKSLTQFEDI
jgi:sugar/nucleoside kinase (ribokinase family)